MEKLKEKNNNEKKKKRKNRKAENKVELKFLQSGKILLISTSNKKTTTFILDINDESTADIINYHLGHKGTVYEIIDYIMLAYKNNWEKTIDYTITQELKFFKPQDWVDKKSLYRKLGFKGNIRDLTSNNLYNPALHFLRIALFLFLFEECSGSPSEVIKRFNERKRKTWRTMESYNRNSLLAYIHKAVEIKFKNIVNDDELFKAKSHKYELPWSIEENDENTFEKEQSYFSNTSSEYSNYMTRDPLKIIVHQENLNEICNTVFKKSSNEEKRLFITFLNIFSYPNAWSKALKINSLKWSVYNKLKRRLKKVLFFLSDDESRSEK